MGVYARKVEVHIDWDRDTLFVQVDGILVVDEKLIADLRLSETEFGELSGRSSSTQRSWGIIARLLRRFNG